MKLTRLAFVTSVILSYANSLVAQTPTSAGLIRHVAARNFVLVVKADGSVVGWGDEESGLAARPRSTTGVVGLPMKIDLPGKARQVAVGLVSAYALLEDGTVIAWGDNHEGQLGNARRLSTGPIAAVSRAAREVA